MTPSSSAPTDDSALRVAALTVYPVKSAAGIAVDTWPVDAFGLAHDRRWAVVDERGVCLTQREHPRMALLRPTLDLEGEHAHLTLEAPRLPPLAIDGAEAGAAPVVADVWGDRVLATPAGAEADRWLHDALGIPCRLVYMPDSSVRPVERGGGPASRVSFADAYPFLVIGEASLADLNARLASPVPMNRFRPSLVVGGAPAFAEDGWRRVRVGARDAAIELTFPKACARCVLTTVDQTTGVKDGKEPLRTLASYRTVDGKVLFGQNAVHHGPGRLAVGDPVTVLA